MSIWFLIVIVLIFLGSLAVLFVRIQSRKEIKRLEAGELTADDFDIIE